MGKRLAKYACQYIGNPYVAGGTSLTNGADCSGFTFRIYSDFGYSIPRTSYEQRSCGTGVDYSSAQPGDLICYDGHVAMYIGGGLIVHASTQRTGIKISNANYRPILAVTTGRVQTVGYISYLTFVKSLFSRKTGTFFLLPCNTSSFS